MKIYGQWSYQLEIALQWTSFQINWKTKFTNIDETTLYLGLLWWAFSRALRSQWLFHSGQCPPLFSRHWGTVARWGIWNSLRRCLLQCRVNQTPVHSDLRQPLHCLDPGHLLPLLAPAKHNSQVVSSSMISLKAMHNFPWNDIVFHPIYLFYI